MKNSFRVALVFDRDLFNKAGIKIKKVIYAKTFDGKKKDGLIKKLKAKALEENIRFQKRRLPRSFNPVFKGHILFSSKIKFSGLANENESLIGFAGLFFDKLEKDFGINIINYSLIAVEGAALKKGYKLKLLDFEMFNYNFNEHRAVKSEFTKAENIKKVNELAGTILTKSKHKSINKKKNPAKPVKERELNIKKEKAIKKSDKTAGEPVSGVDVSKAGTREQINLISLSWSLLSPLENLPVLENGEPAEIRQNSWVRVYFQKPCIRQVVWRLRDKPKTNAERPILRVYKNDKMLWYELLDSRFGSRYIMFPDDYGLSEIWVEIGYTSEKEGGFTFIARSPVWPPACLFKKVPKINFKKRIPKGIALIGATENIPGSRHLPINAPGSGGGFSGSGAGK
ncbi:MAG: hypothetical protein M1458_02740 [Deltaproteobacteria bacterium]|nr:hypothetical protein [Deltaproteobacteria bacterium]